MALGVASGQFAEFGLDVIMQEVPRTGDAMKRLVAGTTEFAVVGAVPVINAARAGDDPVIVMSIEAENVFAIIGASTIGSAADLRGRTIAISGRHEQDEIMIRRALVEWGIDPDADVTLEVFGSRVGCWEAIVSGEAAAMSATIPQPILARAHGLPVLKDFTELHEPYQAGSVVAKRAYAGAEPGIVRRFLAGQLRAVRLFQSDFEAALPYLRARSKLDDIEVLRETHRLFALAAEDYVPNPAAAATVIRNLAEAVGEPVAVDPDQIVDPTFAMALEGRPAYPSVPRVPGA
jgi:ABC-type nitrate/sulfonate/bicarbonate transport system substrate-binding protein